MNTPWTARLVRLQWLWLGLFVFRVGAQLVQVLSPVAVLPHFESWQSGALSYSLLLPGQVLLAIVMAVTNLRLAAGRITPNRRTGGILLSLGSLYAAVMLFRLGASLTFASDHFFLGATLPSVFHLVLGAWVLGLGWHHRHATPAESAAAGHERLVHWLAYPVTIALCLWLHWWLQYIGTGVLFATYVPLIAGAAAITLLERRLPHRMEWRPTGRDVRQDLTFMVAVQVLVPQFLTFLVVVVILDWLTTRGFVLSGFWPHALPDAAQAVLMILVADLLRYWLHRASHEWSPGLWRLHAVHHSPRKLYWVNVGRFHPLEESLQFLCDAAPFILLGVSADVLALYFVFYAVNGFFQHSNVELRLGLLNHLISGPELHRWHHSREPRESNRNYGNNIIIWDLLFGTYHLPTDRQVTLLGLQDRKYPMDFLSQMWMPFVRKSGQSTE